VSEGRPSRASPDQGAIYGNANDKGRGTVNRIEHPHKLGGDVHIPELFTEYPVAGICLPDQLAQAQFNRFVGVGHKGNISGLLPVTATPGAQHVGSGIGEAMGKV
jgi:hypothetical protein